MSNQMNKHTNLIIFIRTAFSLILVRTNAMSCKDERLNALNLVRKTLYPFNDLQYEYLQSRWDACFTMLVDNWPNESNRFDSFSRNRSAISNMIYLTFVCAFFSMQDAIESDLKYNSRVENMLKHADMLGYPCIAMMKCIEHHRITVKGVISKATK